MCTKWVIASDKTTLVTWQSPSSHLVWNRSLCCFSVRRASVKTPEDFAISASHFLLRDVVLDKTADSHVLHLVFMWFWRFKFRSSDLGAKCFSALSRSSTSFKEIFLIFPNYINQDYADYFFGSTNHKAEFCEKRELQSRKCTIRLACKSMRAFILIKNWCGNTHHQ